MHLIERERNFGFWLYDHSDCERRFLDISISYFFFLIFFQVHFIMFFFLVVCLFVLFSLVLFRHCPNMTYIYIYFLQFILLPHTNNCYNFYCTLPTTTYYCISRIIVVVFVVVSIDRVFV